MAHQKRQPSYRRACGHAGLKGGLKPAAPPQYLYSFTCWAFIVSCWSIAGSWRETFSLLSDAAAGAQRLFFNPAACPCCHGRRYHISQLHWNCWSFLLRQLAWSRNRSLGRKIPVWFSLFCPWPLGLFLSQLHFNQLFLLHLICRQFVQSRSHHVDWGQESTRRWAFLSLMIHPWWNICPRWIPWYTLTLDTLPIPWTNIVSPSWGTLLLLTFPLCDQPEDQALTRTLRGLMVQSSPTRCPFFQKNSQVSFTAKSSFPALQRCHQHLDSSWCLEGDGSSTRRKPSCHRT